MNHYDFQALTLGQQEQFTVTITPAMMELFAQIAGDHHPLPDEKTTATSHGFEPRIVDGFLTSSFYSTLAGVYLPGAHALIHRVDVRFTKPVYLGDVLTIVGEITDRIEAFKTITVKATITNQRFDVVSQATIQIGVLL